ncbi:hypothetical protein BC941DRAFT_406555 [Chlamydoabsidia padenii]|nr:hypothetical protein BC941DRAFT_406555 [Chlamydoabsidia padenii]
MKRKVSDVSAPDDIPLTRETVKEKSKKQKKTSGTNHTIPILRGKFKQRWLAKHSSLIKRSDTASGVLISCGLHAETRALGQAQLALERHLELFPSYESTWTRIEGPWDVEDLDKVDKSSTEVEDNNTDKPTGIKDNIQNEGDHLALEDSAVVKKDRTFQAVDTACGGLIFYRFRVNIKPTEFVDKMIDHLVSSSTDNDKKTKEQQFLIRHCFRWMPLDYIMPATTERIDTCFTNRTLPENIVDLPANTTIAIVMEIRNNNTISKQDLIAIIAPKLPTHLKIDLKRPEYVIFVNVFKSVCGISVLKDYYERKKYNIGALM